MQHIDICIDKVTDIYNTLREDIFAGRNFRGRYFRGIYFHDFALNRENKFQKIERKIPESRK